MDLMDVDMSTSPSSGPDHSLTSSWNSSFEKQIKDVLSQDQLTTLNDNMNEDSWTRQTYMTAEGDDLRRMVKSVFLSLTSLLGETAMKNNLVTTQTMREMVKSFSKDELERWKAVVQNCVEKKDWVDLIRMCVSDYQTVGLRSIVTIAALTIPTRPNAASTPLHLSRLVNREAHSK
jgi:hypothetical protein